MWERLRTRNYILIMKTKILQIKEKYKSLIDKAWENYRSVRKDEEDEISKVLNFVGKYLKIYDPLNELNIFIKVKNQCTCPYCGDINKLGLRITGIGFDQENSSDSVWLMLDGVYTYEFDISSISTNLDNVEEITCEEFKKYYIEVSKKAENKFLELIKKA